jgi:hypothetical protein
MTRQKEFNAAQTRERWRKAIRQMLSGDDRSAAIVGGSIVEQCLTAYLQSETVAGDIADKLFYNVIDSFGHKIAAAYVFALIDVGTQRELDLIRKIRNAFAHHILADVEGTEKLTFNTPHIKNFCTALEYPNFFPTTEPDPNERFSLSVWVLSLDLHSTSNTHPLNRKPPPGLADELGPFFEKR